MVNLVEYFLLNRILYHWPLYQIVFIVFHLALELLKFILGTKYVAGGSSFLGAMFNCVVHVFMYTYYALGKYCSFWYEVLFLGGRNFLFNKKV